MDWNPWNLFETLSAVSTLVAELEQIEADFQSMHSAQTEEGKEDINVTIIYHAISSLYHQRYFS